MNALRSKLMELIVDRAEKRLSTEPRNRALNEIMDRAGKPGAAMAFAVYLARATYHLTDREVHWGTKIPVELIDTAFNNAQEWSNENPEQRAWFFRVVSELEAVIDRLFVYAVIECESPVKVAYVKQLVAEEFGLPIAAMDRKWGRANITTAKYAYWMLLHQVCAMSYMDICQACGVGKSMLEHGLAAMENWMRCPRVQDQNLKPMLERLTHKIVRHMATKSHKEAA